jgi:hypothetical protein
MNPPWAGTPAGRSVVSHALHFHDGCAECDVSQGGGMVITPAAWGSGNFSLSKCQIVPIRCEPAHLELATSFFSCTVAEFPVRYIGIPLSVTTLPKIA